VTVLGGTLFRFLYMYSHSFGTLILLVVLANTLGGAPLVLADAFTMEALDDKTDYGKQRLWGAVGWGLAAWLCGAVVTATGIEAMFYLHAFCEALCFWGSVPFSFVVPLFSFVHSLFFFDFLLGRP
jgi:MFS family permease